MLTLRDASSRSRPTAAASNSPSATMGAVCRPSLPRTHLGLRACGNEPCLFGGTLTIESRLGQGTRVTLRLPTGEDRLMPVPLTTRILLADDHELVRGGLKMVLDARLT